MEDMNGKIYEDIIEGLMSKVPLGDKPSKLAGGSPSGVSITIVTGQDEPDGDEGLKPMVKKPENEEEEEEIPFAAKKGI